MSADHPGDIGLLASLLFQHRILAPGEALFMPAGGLHAYIAGVGVEILANSDNVLRAGLTAKHIDIPELLRIADPAADVPVLPPRPLAGLPGAVVYESPAPEFCLYRFTLSSEHTELPASGPRIALCTDGGALLRDSDGTELKLRQSESCFLSDADRAVTATGEGAVFVAAVG
jgi:mannose-6-phosphate isomerase